MSGYGTTTLSSSGRGVGISADGNPDYKIGGVTLDWSVVTAVSGSAVTLADGTVVAIGDKYIDAGIMLAKITASGLYGPYASGASDGRQTILSGECYLTERSIVQSQLKSDYPLVIDGGRVYKDRVVGKTGNPVFATLVTSFPRISWIDD